MRIPKNSYLLNFGAGRTNGFRVEISDPNGIPICFVRIVRTRKKIPFGNIRSLLVKVVVTFTPINHQLILACLHAFCKKNVVLLKRIVRIILFVLFCIWPSRCFKRPFCVCTTSVWVVYRIFCNPPDTCGNGCFWYTLYP